MSGVQAEFDLLSQFKRSLVKKKVGIVEFCESDEFCNTPLYPRQKVLLKLMWLEELDGYEEDVLSEWIHSSEQGGEVIIAPKIRERVEWLRERNYDHFTTIQLVQGRRSGKGFVTGASMAKKIYDLIQMEDPQTRFSVRKGENIYFSIVADSQDQAKKYQFKDARNWVLDCLPLQEFVGQPLAESIPIYTPTDMQRIGKLRNSSNVKGNDSLASLRVEAFAKNARTIRGQASIVFVFDEMAHITPGESHISDEELFKAAEPSLMQFGSHAMLFANSSPYTKIGKFFKLYQQAMELDGGEVVYPAQMMLQSPSWEMFKDWERDKRFSKAVSFSPDADHPDAYEMKQKERANPESFRVEYRAQFAEVVDAYLNPKLVDQMFDPDITRSVIGRFLEPTHGGTVEYVYKAHGDPSATGANFGFAIGHTEYIDEMDTETGTVKPQVPHVVFDVIDAFYPEDFENHTIDWLEILPVFADYINKFRPFEFTFDQFNSHAPIQMLQAEAQKMGAWETQIGMKTATATVNRQRAINFKTALNLGRVHAPHPNTHHGMKNSIDLARAELKFLQEKGGRIDKQDIGPVQTKDIADCIMEVVDVLIGQQLQEEYNMLNNAPAFGAPGGYAIGSNNRAGADDPFQQFYGDMRHAPQHNRAWGRPVPQRTRRR